MLKKSRSIVLVVMCMSLAGCLSAGTNARLCSDLGIIGKIANAFGSKVGSAVGEYTPKKCLNGGISGDTGNLSGGINLGVNNEPSDNALVNPEPSPVADEPVPGPKPE